MPPKQRERKLPSQQLAILAICRFAEPLATTSLFPYLPEYLRSLGVPQNSIGKWAGICAAVFSLSQAVMGIPWGLASDAYGRKPAILCGLFCTMATSLMWGFSKSLSFSILVRALAGAGNGNVGIIRTTVAEMVPFKELQPRAFSIMPLVWNVGSIFGPSIGGALANPFDVSPGEDVRGGNLLKMFPYALPNIVSAAFFAVGISVGILFLEETLETRKGKRDWGLVAGRKITGLAKSHVLKIEEILHLRENQAAKPGPTESDPLLKDDDSATPTDAKPRSQPPKPSLRSVLTPQANLNLLVYALLAAHSMAYDQLLPVFMSYPPMPDGSHPTGNSLHFAGGFGLHHFKIGLLSTCYGAFGMLVQFFLFPPVARHCGVLNCLRVCSLVFPLLYLATPFTALLPTQRSQVGVCFGIMLVKCFCAIFSFPCSTILLTNSASSLRTLGTLNGFATSFSAIGRALGPALAGGMFSVGVERGYIIAPWWLLSGLGILGAIPVFFLVEGEGFGGDEEDGEIDDDDDVAEEEHAQEVLHAEGVESGAEAKAGKPGPLTVPSRGTVQDAEEEGYGSVAPLGGMLSRTTTRSSVEGTADGEGQRPGVSRTPSYVEAGRPGLGPRRRTTRRMSIPFGMGRQGVDRRYSSNLGQSFGSAGSFNGP